MATADLKFDVSALDRASATFTRLGRAVERFEKKLDEINGKRVEAELGVKTDKAEREVGAFARDMQRRITAAVRALPEIELDADATQAQRELARVRTELQALGEKRIGVDIDAAAAEAELARLNGELKRLGAESADVQVQADTAAALAALKVVDAEVDRLDGRTARVKVDIDRSLSESLIRVAALGRALSALALPAAAVAIAPQLAGIGSAAVAASGALALLPAVGAAATASIATLVVGLQGLGDALKVRDDAEKFAEALKKLSPAAREFATTVRDLGPAWKTVQLDVQQHLLEGLGQELSKLSGTWLPKVQQTLVGIANGFNLAGHEVAGFLTSTPEVARLSAALDKIRVGASNATGAILPAVEALATLVEVGANRLPRLGEAITDAATRFRDFVNAAAESGALDRFIDRGVATVKQLGRITADVGRSLLSVFRAADDAGVGFLDTVERITSRVDDFLKSVEGRQTVAAFFRGIREIVDALTPGAKRLAEAVVHVVGALGQSGTFVRAAQALSAIAQAAAPVLELLGDLASVVLPPLLSLLQLLSPVLVPVAAGLLAIKAASSLSAAMQRFPLWLTSTKTAAEAADTGLGRAASSLRRFRDEMRLQQSLGAASGESVGKFGAALAVLARDADRAGDATTRSGRGVAAFSSAVQGAAGRVDTLAQSTAKAADRAAAALENRLPAAAKRAGDGLAKGLATGADGVARAMDRVAASISDKGLGGSLGSALASGAAKGMQAAERALLAGGKGLARVADGIGNGVLNGLMAGFRGADKAVGAALDGILAGLKRVESGMAAAGRGILTGLKAVESGIVSAGSAMARGADAVGNAGLRMLQGFKSGVDAAMTGIGRINEVPGIINRAMSSAASGAANGARSFATAVAEMPKAVASAASTVATHVAGIPRVFSTLASSVGSAVTTAAGHLSTFAGTVGRIGTSIGTGIGRAASSLVGFLGGPWGVAFAAAGVALSIFAQKQQEAAQAAAEHESKVKGLVGTLNQLDGAVTQATKAQIAQDIAARKLSDGTTSFATAMQAAGINVRDFAAAATGNEQALRAVTEQLRAAAQATPGFMDTYRELQPTLDAAGISLQEFTDASLGNEQALQRLANAFGMSVDTLRENAHATTGPLFELGSALQEYGKQVDEAQQRTRTAAQAAEDFTTTLDGIKAGMAGLKDGAAPLGPMVLQFQSLGRSAADAALSAGKAAEEYGGVAAGAQAAEQAMQQSRDAFIAAATGAGLTAEEAAKLADQIGLIPAAARTIFETNATGVTAELITLKAQFDAVPGSKTITVDALSDAAKQKLIDLGATVTTLPNGQVLVDVHDEAGRAKVAAFLAFASTQIGTMLLDANPNPANGKISQTVALGDGSTATMTFDANAAPADGKIKAEVTFADGSRGTMTLDANPDPATGQINATVSYGDGQTSTITLNPRDLVSGVISRLQRPTESTHTIHVQVVGNTAGLYGDVGGIKHAAGAYAIPRAAGAYTKPAWMAEGGMRRMSAYRAEVVPARQPRVIGDRMAGDEAFIPINRSVRSRQILDLTARRMGYDLVARTGGLGDRIRSAVSTATASHMRALPASSGQAAQVMLQLGPVVAAVRQLQATMLQTAPSNLDVVDELRQVRAAVLTLARGSAADSARSARLAVELGEPWR